MNLKELKIKIVIENLRGSYKKFADSLDEYAILGVTFPTHYGYIDGYIGEDTHDLDVFVGNGEINGVMVVFRPDVEGNEETKMILNVSKEEYDLIEERFKPVINEMKKFDENDFLEYIEKFKSKSKKNEFRLMLYPKDFEKVQKFYTDILNFPVMKEWDQGIMMDAETGVIELLKSEKEYKPVQGVAASIEVKKVKKFWEKIKDNSEIIFPLRHNDWGDTSFCIKDPEGFELSFFSKDN